MSMYGYDELRAAARLVRRTREHPDVISPVTYREAALLLADYVHEHLDEEDERMGAG